MNNKKRIVIKKDVKVPQSVQEDSCEVLRESVISWERALTNLERIAQASDARDVARLILGDIENTLKLPVWLLYTENAQTHIFKTNSEEEIRIEAENVQHVLSCAGIKSIHLAEIQSAQGGIVTELGVPRGCMLDIHAKKIKPSLRALKGAIAGAARERDERGSALMDINTGVWNRTGFVTAAKAFVESSNKPIAIYLVDLAGFGRINSALGHEVGDEILRESAKRLTLYANRYPVGRIASDAFAIAMPQEFWEGQRLESLFMAPFEWGGLKLSMQVRVGAALAKRGQAASVWLSRCAGALEEAKRLSKSGAQVQWFDPAQESLALERLEITEKLTQALECTDQLYMAYQPQIRLCDKKILGVEALLRWRLPNGSFIGPDKFIPIAEQAGLASKISDFTIESTLAMLTELDAKGLYLTVAAVNISAGEMEDALFCQKIESFIRKTPIAPERLELEVTETAAAQNPDAIARTLEALKGKGFKTALDDFGSGYSSLGRLASFPLDKIKIDKVFVQALGGQSSMANIALIIAQMGKALGIEVLAEGVETQEQEALLEALAIEGAQGWLYSKALCTDELAHFIQSWQDTRGR